VGRLEPQPLLASIMDTAARKREPPNRGARDDRTVAAGALAERFGIEPLWDLREDFAGYWKVLDWRGKIGLAA